MRFYIWQISIFLLIVCLNANILFATGVVDSGHNMLKQGQDVSKLEKGGVCSFCHKPHSAGGNMDPSPTEDNNMLQYKFKKYGATGNICQQTVCHGTNPKGPNMTQTIFLLGLEDRNHPLLFDTTDPYGTTGTKQWMSNWPGTSKNHLVPSGALSNAGYATIECTSCHNVHSVTEGITFTDIATQTPNGTGQSGEFLRAKAFDTTSAIANVQVFDPADRNTRKQIFCEYCHMGRSTMGWGPYNSLAISRYNKSANSYTVDGISTHPIGKPRYSVAADGIRQRAIKDNSLNGSNVRGWNGSILIDKAFVAWRKRTDVANGGVANAPVKSGHMGGNSDAEAGFETTDVTAGIVICQSCHVPHNANPGGQFNANENVLGISDSYVGEMLVSRPDLLVMGNRVSDTSLIEGGVKATGFNALCENCHSYRPFLRVQATDLATGDVPSGVVGHPLRHHKATGASGGASTDGNYNHTDNWDSSSFKNTKNCNDDAANNIQSILIPKSWPSGQGLGDLEQDGYAVVCLTCHDVHGGKPNTSLLRAIPLCVECHKGPIASLGISHPVNVSLTNEDGGVWEDQASLTLFTPPTLALDGKTVLVSSSKIYDTTTYSLSSDYEALKSVKARSYIKVSCETCHDWTNGNIHYNVRRIRNVRLETQRTGPGVVTRLVKGEVADDNVVIGISGDTNAESQLCSSCHTNDDYTLLPGTGDNAAGTIPNGNIRKGTGDQSDGGVGANISPYTREYPVAFTGKNLMGPDGVGNGTGLDMESDLNDRDGTHATQVQIKNKDEGESGNEHPARFEWVYRGIWGDRADFTGGLYNSSCVKFSGKKSKWGSNFPMTEADTSKAIIVCQSCHTPHKAAAGLVEYNTGAVTKEQSPHSALLLATQAESYMCRFCHLKGGNVAHPVSIPSSGLGSERDTTGSGSTPASYAWYLSSNRVGGPTRMRRSDVEHNLVLTIEAELARVNLDVTKKDAVYLRDSSDIDVGGWKWGVRAVVTGFTGGPAKPANYPKALGSLNNNVASAKGYPGEAVTTDNRLVCDSCHAPHSAGTAMGTYCLEGNDTSVPGVSQVGGSTENYVGRIQDNGGGAAQPALGNDNPTCILCHIQ